jgi:hypothetical protein
MVLQQTARQKLAEQATVLKKAWLLCVASMGNDFIQKNISPAHLSIPNYRLNKPGDLRSEIKDLEYDLKRILNDLVEAPRESLSRVAQWLAARFDTWQASKPGMFTISTVLDFESNVGRLRARKFMEVPAYGEVFLQPIGTTIRHPEYFLVRDLGLLWELYLDAERIMQFSERHRRQDWGGRAGENLQSLARSIVIACFNLLEAFASGLARQYLMTHPQVDTGVQKKLEGTYKPLGSRLIALSSLISGKTSSLDINKPPLAVMFGPIKSHRDAFVHCEPGPQSSERGYRKEAVFHDVGRGVVEDALRSTFEIIKTIWADVYGHDKPRWLPEWSGGRFGNPNLRLCPEEWSYSSD